MPKLGEIMQEAEITRWLKAEGEAVNQGEPIVEVMTEKVNVNLEAPASGVVLKIYAPEGKMVALADPLCAIGSQGEPVPEARTASAAAVASP
jgi:pyruvate/2-oxoglutarate dehydrogenase complex dihydrolipoamide acyltransferase (E2) component